MPVAAVHNINRTSPPNLFWPNFDKTGVIKQFAAALIRNNLSQLTVKDCSFKIINAEMIKVYEG